MKNLINIFIAIAIISALVLMAKIAVEKQEKIDCYKLQNQAVEFESAGYFITQDEKAMCDRWEIQINAVVK